MRAGGLAAAGVALAIMIGACGAEDERPATGTSTPPSPVGTSASPTPESRTYSTGAGGGFSFSYPASWGESTPATGLVEVVVGAPPEDAEGGFAPNINVVVEPLRVDLDTPAYFEASLQAVSSSFEGFDLRDQGRVTIGGEEARWIEYEWVSEGRTVRQRQAYLVRGENGFILTFTATPGAFEDHLGSQLLVESTFRFDD